MGTRPRIRQVTKRKPDDPIEQRLCVALYQASHAMNAAYRELLDPLDLTYTQYTAMSVLWQDGPTEVTKIAQRLGLESSTVSPLVKRLETRGWVNRRRGQDERTVVVGLTPEGERLGQQARDVPRRRATITGLDEDQQAELVTQLHALTEHLRSVTAPS